jgi:hypothetical protein
LGFNIEDFQQGLNVQLPSDQPEVFLYLGELLASRIGMLIDRR